MSKKGNAQNAAKCKAYKAAGTREKNRDKRMARIARGLAKAAEGHTACGHTNGQERRHLRRIARSYGGIA